MTEPPDHPGARRAHRGRGVLLGVGLLLVVLVGGFAVFRWIAQPDDPPDFYDPPDALPSGAPGTIIREDQRDGHEGQQVWRVLYTSTDSQDRPIAVSGVIVAPDEDPPAGGWPVIAWAHGTSGIVPRCAPSLYPEDGLPRVPELDALLASGAVVAITDYPGLGTPGIHPYLVGESEGRAVLDSIRAARALLGEQTSARAAVYGHSQGGHAAVFADALAPAYAPELDITGVAAMAPPTDLGVLLDDDKHEPNGIVLTALAIDSWDQVFPDTDADTVVHELARPVVRDIGSNCIITTAEGLTDVPDVLALSTQFLSTDPSTAPGWSTRLEENSPDSLAPGIPLLVAQGLTDDIVRPEVTEQFVQQQCAAGAVIELQEYPDTGHFAVRATAAPAVRDWLLARLDGQPAPAGCSTTTEATG